MTAKTAARAESNGAPEHAEALGDLEVILPPSGEVVIEGVKCSIRHLKAREFFMLMGILTNGLGPGLAEIQWTGMDADTVGATLIASFVMAIPNAMEQFLNLVLHVVEPEGTDADRKRVKEYLLNPEIDDLLPVLDAIIENEKENIVGLVGKARGYLTKWQATFRKMRQPTS